MDAPDYSLIVPVYRNEGSITDLLEALEALDAMLGGGLQVVFTVDGSPDRSYELLSVALPSASFRAKLVLLSRNFGSFAAIRAGLATASGRYFAVMAADLQEPPELMMSFFTALANEPVDVTIGVRMGRDDPLLQRWASKAFWWLYRRFVQREIPVGGIDVFGCNLTFRHKLLSLEESNSSLVGQIMWLGFRRKLIPYQRARRRHGKSAWTLGGKVTYLMDSLFAFSDLPIRVLIGIGLIGLVLSFTLSLVVLVARLTGAIPIPGYTATVLTITIFAALNSLGLGIIGSYAWRGYENTKGRPQAIVLSEIAFGDDR